MQFSKRISKSIREKLSLRKIILLIFIFTLSIILANYFYGNSECRRNFDGVVALDKNAHNILVLGDTGKAGARRTNSILGVEKLLKNIPFNSAFLLGDNFYPNGVKSLSDTNWDTHFNNLFDSAVFDFPFYAVLGNHDHRGNTQAQIDFSVDNNSWIMPSNYYEKTFYTDEESPSSILAIFLDTDILRKDAIKNSEQYVWLESVLRLSNHDFVIISGHHPVYSNGHHGGDAVLQDMIGELSLKYQIDIYLSGHDHDIQILKPRNNVHYVVSGAFAKVREANCLDDSIYATNKSIGIVLSISNDNIKVMPINELGNIDYIHKIIKRDKR